MTPFRESKASEKKWLSSKMKEAAVQLEFFPSENPMIGLFVSKKTETLLRSVWIN